MDLRESVNPRGLATRMPEHVVQVPWNLPTLLQLPKFTTQSVRLGCCWVPLQLSVNGCLQHSTYLGVIVLLPHHYSGIPLFRWLNHFIVQPSQLLQCFPLLPHQIVHGKLSTSQNPADSSPQIISLLLPHPPHSLLHRCHNIHQGEAGGRRCEVQPQFQHFLLYRCRTPVHQVDYPSLQPFGAQLTSPVPFTYQLPQLQNLALHGPWGWCGSSRLSPG